MWIGYGIPECRPVSYHPLWRHSLDTLLLEPPRNRVIELDVRELDLRYFQAAVREQNEYLKEVFPTLEAHFLLQETCHLTAGQASALCRCTARFFSLPWCDFHDFEVRTRDMTIGTLKLRLEHATDQLQSRWRL